jgi:pimeloyl-ACP methyl ester carboxylesterase
VSRLSFLRAASVCAVLASSVLAVAAEGPRTPSPAFDQTAYIHPQRLVAVGGGRRLNLYCSGSGKPAVILEAGAGGSMLDWYTIQPAIARTTEVCSYDRAGREFSEPAPASGSGLDSAVDDLHALLQAAAIAPPYVLVGHSLGGVIVLSFAERYRAEVAGMVLVDPGHPEMFPRIAAALTPAPVYDKLVAQAAQHLNDCIAAARRGTIRLGSKAYKVCVSPPDPKFGAALKAAEQRRQTRLQWWEATKAETRMLENLNPAEITGMQQSLGTLPLIVLTASAHTISGISRRQQIAIENLWKTMHGELAALSSDGLDRSVRCSTHFIQLDCPSVVIGAIDELISRVRSTRSRQLAPSPESIAKP